MKKWIKRLMLGVLAGFLTLLPASPVLASVASPGTMVLNTIEAYQSVRETDDQLYLVTFSLDYGTNPTGYTADEAFIFRLKDSGVEIAAKSPYAYYDSGYAAGVVSFYFAADDANLPTWGSASISVEMVGNPSIDWTAGDPPTRTNSIVDAWNTEISTLIARLIFIAQQLEPEYNDADLISYVSGVQKFSSAGEIYFETTIENLREFASDLFSDIVTTPTVREITYTNTIKEAAEDRWIGDTVFDLTDLSAMMGISRMWLTSIAWLLLSMVVLFFAAKYIGDASSLIVILGIMFIIGSFTGFMSFDVGIWVGVGGALILVYKLVYKGAT